MSDLSRRSFLSASAATAAASALTLPASAQPVGANERLNVGLIGTGGRCRHLMQALVRALHSLAREDDGRFTCLYEATIPGPASRKGLVKLVYGRSAVLA